SFYNGKLVHTLLEGHSILSLEGSLSGDRDVEKNGKWSYIYAVGSQEYQMVCTRLDISSKDVVEKIYAHESLIFNNTVACEIISKWKAGLKDDMDARSDVYVLSNGCRKCSDDNDGYYWEYTPAKGNVLGMKIIMDQSGNTLRVPQSSFYNGKLVHTLLEGHSILSLEGSLSG
nr:zinc finger, CCHC-type [Tanacetum cinerariifolium]